MQSVCTVVGLRLNMKNIKTAVSYYRECETFSVNNVLEGLLW